MWFLSLTKKKTKMNKVTDDIDDESFISPYFFEVKKRFDISKLSFYLKKITLLKKSIILWTLVLLLQKQLGNKKNPTIFIQCVKMAMWFVNVGKITLVKKKHNIKRWSEYYIFPRDSEPARHLKKPFQLCFCLKTLPQVF